MPLIPLDVKSSQYRVYVRSAVAVRLSLLHAVLLAADRYTCSCSYTRIRVMDRYTRGVIMPFVRVESFPC